MTSKQLTACLLVYNTIPDDPRVRRQGDVLSEQGWNVVGIGLPGGRDTSPEWLKEEKGEASPLGEVQRSLLYKAVRIVLPEAGDGVQVGVVRKYVRTIIRIVFRALAIIKFALLHALVLIRPSTHNGVYWRVLPVAATLYERAQLVKADVWVANDWNTLPIALRLARENGGAILYDTHEFAVDEYDQKLLWRLLRKPLVQEIEKEALKSDETVVVSTVSDGIASALAVLYDLPSKPMVVRNTPKRVDVTARPVERPIKILYHGVVAPGRGLEVSIEAMRLLGDGYHLSIRGPADPSYAEELNRQVTRAGLADRVALIPPVPMTDLVAQATVFDIGLFSLPGHSRHNQFALPNKLFEYIGAGLCVCVSALPEMKAIVEHYNVGKVFEDETAQGIATTIGKLTPEEIYQYKRKSLAAAEDLCWESESRKFVKMLSDVTDMHRAAS